MSSNFNPTEIEQKVLDLSRRLLGSNLFNYLLSGLGDNRVTHCRAFTARSTSRHSKNVTYQFEMINDYGQGLPRGRDPLVLAALLLLLRHYQITKSTVHFPEGEIMETLGWPVNSESKAIVRGAIERYLLTAFYLIDPTISEDERIFGRYARFRRLLVGYEATWLHSPVKRKTSEGPNQYLILPEFTQSEISEAKRFLGVEFQSLREMREISC